MSLTTLGGAALFLLIAAAALARWLGGPAAVLPAVACGGVAAVTQLAAARMARRAFAARFNDLLAAWALGVGLRFAGVVILAAATLAAPAQFPPIPSAFGFLGVLIPLLLLEIRLTR
jgi:hypothetical protein